MSHNLEELHRKLLSDRERKSKYYTVENLLHTLNVQGIENLENLNFSDCEVSVSDLIAWAASEINSLNEENERLNSSLEYIYDSGSLLNRDVVDKARWGLGLDKA